MTDGTSHTVTVTALSQADALGYRGQQAVAKAVGDLTAYRLIGGHMVRLLLAVYPCERAAPRTTVDADTALDEVEIIGDVAARLRDDGFVQTGGNVFQRSGTRDDRDPGDGTVEINLLLPRTGSTAGVRPTRVPGVGQVDTLSELTFVMMHPPLVVDVTARLNTEETLTYRIRIPGLEAAVVLKAHSWRSRSSVKDLADLVTLLEIREAHPTSPWRLNEAPLQGRRLDTARILHDLAERSLPRTSTLETPAGFDRVRFAALVSAHISRAPSGVVAGWAPVGRRVP